MKSNIFRCGWCGRPTDNKGNQLDLISFDRVVRIIETYGDYRTIKRNGSCCPNGNY